MHCSCHLLPRCRQVRQAQQQACLLSFTKQGCLTSRRQQLVCVLHMRAQPVPGATAGPLPSSFTALQCQAITKFVLPSTFLSSFSMPCSCACQRQACWGFCLQPAAGVSYHLAGSSQGCCIHTCNTFTPADLNLPAGAGVVCTLQAARPDGIVGCFQPNRTLLCKPLQRVQADSAAARPALL